MIKTIIFSILIIGTVASCNNDTRTNSEKIDTQSDSTNLSETTPRFSKTLAFQGFKFDVSTAGEGSIQQLTIQPYGLKEDSSKIEMEIDGSVNSAEIDDLNADGFPELLIYTVSAGSGSYGNVIGYSVNEGVDFPSLGQS